jgi:hypothetical protein
MSNPPVRHGLERFLERGERIEHVLRATSGPRAAVWLGSAPKSTAQGTLLVPVLIPLARALKVRNYIIAVTDRAILLIAASQFAEHPRELIARLPRRTPLGPFEGRGWITVNGIRLWVRDVAGLRVVQEADRAIGHETGPPDFWRP